MTTTDRQSLADYLSLTYPYQVIADPTGGYFIQFPDLPGCMTQVEERDDIGAMADEIRELWIEAVYERGDDIPLPSTSAGYSGKFVMRIPRSLHRTLAESAEREGVSLNQYASVLLARGDVLKQVEGRQEKHASPSPSKQRTRRSLSAKRAAFQTEAHGG